ncbi:hypothetical protein ACFL2C_00760 [Patescibacteria group bacterium]
MKGISLLKIKDTLFLFAVIALGVIASRTLLFQSGYFNMHDDLQLMRQLELEKCFMDGQIPCRWVPDMGYGFGFPLFNFYPPLPYLFGQIFRWVGFDFITTVKLTFASAIILSGITMHYLSKEFFGRWGGLLASAFYVWAPYHAVDVYVRGAMNESWALVWFPLILWSAYKLLTSKKKLVARWTIVLGVSFTLLMLSHNLMLLIFTPVLAVWVLLHLILRRSWSRIPNLIISGLLAFGLSAFFTIPAVTENKFTQIKSTLVGYYDYSAHFVTIKQLLISRYWDYGPSVWMDADDRMSFQIGHLHWILSLLVGILVLGFVVGYLKKPKLFRKVVDIRILLATGLMVGAGWFAAFLTHSRSTPIWKAVTPLEYTQFPWRFLTIVIFAFSFAIGFLPYILSNLSGYRSKALKILSYPFRAGLVILIIFVLIGTNWNFFLPEHGKMGPLTDEEKFSDAAWDLQQTAGIYDYLPSTAVTAPKEPMKELVETMEGEVVVNNTEQGTDWARMSVSVKSEDAVLRLGIFQFPNWKTYVDGQEVANYVPNTEKWGRMYIDVPRGEHAIEAIFTNTTVRTVSNFISLFTWVGLGAFIVYYHRKKLQLR